MSRIVAFIEVRMTSSRLPGKVLMPVCGKPVTELLVERVRRIPQIDDIVLTTTWNDTDDPLQALADKLGVLCYRGSENDVLGRVLGAAKTYRADYVLEITGDCPLLDPTIASECIDEYFAQGADYGVVAARFYPSGTAIQIFPTSILAEVDREYAEDPEAREHVSLPIYRQPERYKLYYKQPQPVHHRPELRLDLDTSDDFALISDIFERLYLQDDAFTLAQVIALIDADPDLRSRATAA